jgi:hypothetical protein
MSQDPSSLWPSGIRAKIQSPKALLKIQAEALARQTGGVLMGDVRQKEGQEDRTAFSFDIVVPALDNYRHPILNVAYKKELPYPCVIEAQYFQSSNAYDLFMVQGRLIRTAGNVAENDDEFLSILGVVLQSPQVVSVAQSLIARATEAQDESGAAG